MLWGREQERGRIDDVMADASAGRSTCLALVGEPGVGKTALLDHARARAERGGWRVLSTAGLELDTDFSYASLHELLYPVLDRIEQLPDVQAQALRGAFALDAATHVGRLYIGAASLSLLAAAAADDSLLCLVDDAQWLDPPSLDALVFAARRFEAERVAVLFAGNPSARYPPRGLAQLWIGGLDPTASAAWVRSLAPSIAEDVMVALTSSTEGNPLALMQSVSLLSEGQLTGREHLPTPLPVGADLAQAYLTRGAAVPEGAWGPLRLAAASDTTSLRVLDRADASATAALLEAEELGLVVLADGRVRFTHPLLKAAVYRSASPAERRELHARLAAGMAGEPSYRERRAWHLAAASAGPDDEVADELEAVASTAVSRRAHLPAADLFERAAGMSTRERDRLRRLVAGAQEARLGGDGGRAAGIVADVLSRAPSPDVEADARIVALRLASATRTTVDLTDAVDLAVGLAEVDAERATRVLAAASDVAGDRAVDLAQRAVELAPRGGSGEIAAGTALAKALATGGDTPDATAEAERVVALLPEDDPRAEDPELLVGLVDALAAVGADVDRIEPLLERAASEARTHAVTALPTLSLHRSRIEHSRGDWPASLAHAYEAARLAEETGQRRLALVASFWLGLVEARLGHEEGARHQGAVVEELGGELALDGVASLVDGLEGTLLLAVGQPEQAAAPLRRWVTTSGPWIIVAPSDPEVMDALEAAIKRGEGTGDLQERLTGDGPVGRACVAWAEGLAGDGLAGFERALAELEGMERPRPYLVSRIHLAAGARQRRDGERIASRESLRAALNGFERLGAAGWAAQAAAELSATGERLRRRDDPSIGELTPQEAQVARVIASGLSNKDAAARLYLAPKTIEYHLTKIYRKLGVQSARELAAVFAARAGEDL